MRADYRTGHLSEDGIMGELIDGVEFFIQLRQCFPAKSVDADSHRIILTAIIAASGIDLGEASATTISVGDNLITKLKEEGILLDNSRIASPGVALFIVPTS